MHPAHADRWSPPPVAGPRLGRGAWLAAAAGLVCFLSSLANDFTYDDLAIIRDNPRIRSLTDVRAIWLSDWWKPTDPDDLTQARRDRLYRPLTLYTFALNYGVGGLRPIAYHAVNVVLHAGVCLLVWWFGVRFLGDRVIADIGALVFAVHPVHSEAVANVVGRAEMLATLFLLLGLWVLLPRDRVPGWRRTVAASVLFLAALFSKETAVCYVPVALLALHALAERPAQHRARWWLMHTTVLLTPLVLYLPLRYVALEHHLLRDMAPHELVNPLVAADGPHRWLHAFTVLGHYVRLLVVPMKLSCNYGVDVIDPDGGPELLTWVGGLATVAAAIALLGYMRPAGLWRQLAVLTAVWAASYALISNTVLLIGVSVGERLLYWPSVPMLLALVLVIVQVWRWATQRGTFSPDMARLLRWCGVLLLAGLGLRSVVRNLDWQSNLALFERDVETYPQSAELHEAVGNELLWKVKELTSAGTTRGVRALLERADQHLETSLSIYPTYATAMQRRGRALAMLGHRARALVFFEEASRLGPLDRVSRELLARLRDEAGDQAARVQALTDQIATRPTDAALYVEYGELLLKWGRDQEALATLEEAVRLDPENPEALRLLGDACATRQEDERAVDAYRRALARDPNLWLVHLNLVTLLAGKDRAAALRHAQEAYRLAPDELVTQRQLAEALVINERPREALALYEHMLGKLASNDPLRPVIEDRLRKLRRLTP